MSAQQVALAAVATAAVAAPLAQQVHSKKLDVPKKKVTSFKGLDSDDVRHPLDAQNTRLLRSLPGLDFVAKSLMGMLVSLETSFCGRLRVSYATLHHLVLICE